MPAKSVSDNFFLSYTKNIKCFKYIRLSLTNGNAFFPVQLKVILTWQHSWGTCYCGCPSSIPTPQNPTKSPRELHANAHVAHKSPKHAHTHTHIPVQQRSGGGEEEDAAERAPNIRVLSRSPPVFAPRLRLFAIFALSRNVFRNTSGSGSNVVPSIQSFSRRKRVERASPIQSGDLALLHLCKCVFLPRCVRPCKCVCVSGGTGALVLGHRWVGRARAFAAAASQSASLLALTSKPTFVVRCLRVTNTRSGFCADFRF